MDTITFMTAIVFAVPDVSMLITFFKLSLFSRSDFVSRFGACVITLGRANAVNCEPGNGSLYGGGGVDSFDGAA